MSIHDGLFVSMNQVCNRNGKSTHREISHKKPKLVFKEIRFNPIE